MNTNIDLYSLLKISGADAASFLQGQLTNDVHQLGKTWQFSGYCNPKGRLIALFMLWEHQGDYYALLNTDLAESTQKRLQMFVLRSKVTIEMIDSATVSGLTTKDLRNSDYASAKQPCRGDFRVTDRLHCLEFDDRVLLINTAGSDSALVNAGMNDSQWLAADIEQGLPSVSAHTTELFVPQMLNLDLLAGINFQKGCYTGQEIVARMHYLGKLKQRMYRCEIDSPTAAQPGDRIFLVDDQRSNVGNLVTQPINQSALAVLRIEHAQKPLQLENGSALKVADQQPYPHSL